jgi:hypothetical protein
LGTILAFLILTVVPNIVSKHPQDENGNDDQTNAE